LFVHYACHHRWWPPADASVHSRAAAAGIEQSVSRFTQAISLPVLMALLLISQDYGTHLKLLISSSREKMALTFPLCSQAGSQFMPPLL